MIHVLDYAKSFLGVPYKWGGNNALDGFDCSGLVCEILRAAGVMDRCDYSAQDIFNIIQKKSNKSVKRAGAVAFYGKSATQVYHVAFHLDEFLIIEAGGGDASVTTKEEAERRGAMVRVRKFDYRKDYLFSLYPDYSTIGLVF